MKSRLAYPPLPGSLLPARALRWPAPALLAWLLAWALCLASRSAGLAPSLAWLAGVAAGAGVAATASGRWRRLMVAAGFPLSSLVLASGVPEWGWIAAAALLLLAYPVSAWRDAPFYPTPADALRTLPEVLQLPPGARVLDLGCGLGHALVALRAAYPQARIEGIERSTLLALVCRWRCRFARVVQGDIWTASWHGRDCVYLFQRPDTMSQAWDKACREMERGSWLVSLEFEVPGARPHARLLCVAGKPVWVYRVGAAAARGRSTASPGGR